MPEITENGAILIGTLSRYIANYENVVIDASDLEDLLGENGAFARRILILGGMKPSRDVPDVWQKGIDRWWINLTDDPTIAAVIRDWMPEAG